MFTDIQIGPIALPSNALQSFYASLGNLGYKPQSILTQYPIPIGSGNIFSINAVAFANPPHRISAEYASFTLCGLSNSISPEKIVPQLALSSAPFHIIHHDNIFDFYVSQYEYNGKQPVKVSSKAISQNIVYSELANVLNAYRRDLQPERLMRVKRGLGQFESPVFQSVLPLQLSLFVQGANKKRLVEYFGTAIQALRTDGINETEMPSVATQLLGIAILTDTGALGNAVRLNRNIDLGQLYRLASEKFPSYFTNLGNLDAYENAFKILQNGSYTTFEPDMLTALYGAAYNQEERRELGRYDTPLYLTHRMWENIPVELLPPNKRVVADMTCGWGSFLIAGYDRLVGLSDDMNPDLAQRLRGNDINSFASSLARLGLLLHTGQDSWEIDVEDALNGWLENVHPDIIVGNPPFEGNRKRHDESDDNEHHRREKAVAFLDSALTNLNSGGYLAMLMPFSFLASESGPKLRKRLLNQSDIYELWEIPIGVFEATASAVAIFAHKKEKGSSTVRIRTIKDITAKTTFRNPHGQFTKSVVADSSNWQTETGEACNFNYTVILLREEWLKVRTSCVNLSEIAYFTAGAIEGQDVLRKKFRDFPQPIKVQYLKSAKKSAVKSKPFRVNYEHSIPMNYPNDFERPRLDYQELLLGTKVLLSSNQSREWGKKNTIIIERNGYLPSAGFWVIGSKDEGLISLETLAAILDWVVVNAWILDNITSPKISSRSVQTLPIPLPERLTSEVQQKLAISVRMLENIETSTTDEKVARTVIDELLKDAYDLSDEVFKRLKQVHNWNKEKIITLDKVRKAPDSDMWITNGIVNDVDVLSGTVTLQFDEFPKPQEVSIHPSMPGWMLRPNAQFRTQISYECVQQKNLSGTEWGTFLPQMYTYMNEDEILDGLFDATS